MTITEQIDEFSKFAKRLAEQGEEISVREALELWEARDEDAQAIQEAIDSYEAGERGTPAREFLAEVRATRAKANS